MGRLFYGLVFMVVQWINIYLAFFLFTLFVWCYMRLFLLGEETEMPVEFLWASESFESLILERSSRANHAKGSYSYTQNGVSSRGI